VRLAGLWATAGSTGEWPEMRVHWELDDWDHLARASARQHPMEERDPYLTELWNQALDFRRGGHSMLLRPAPFSPDLATVAHEGITGDVVLCEVVRSRPGGMAAYHEALASTYVPRAREHGVRLWGAYEHAIVPNVGLTLWVLAGWDAWRALMEDEQRGGGPPWNDGVDQWLADRDGCLIVPPPAEVLRT
jgi:hypothetical protein